MASAVSITVRKRKEGSLNVTDFSSETQKIEGSRIVYVAPSLCKYKILGDDTLIKSKIVVSGTAGDPTSTVTFWVTELVSAITW